MRGDAIAAHESKWYHHGDAVSFMLRFKDVKLFDEYILSLEKGGTGSKKSLHLLGFSQVSLAQTGEQLSFVLF